MQIPLDIDQVYRDHGHVVLRRARRILGDENDAREVLQEIFLSLLDKPEQFAGRSSINTWLYRATTNLCLNRIRRHKNRARLLRDVIAPALSDKAPSRAEDMAHVNRLLNRLPDKLARVAILYYMDELTQEEIAGVLGCSRRQVGALLERFRARAQKQMRRAA